MKRPPRRGRSGIARYAAPVAFLLAATIAVLLVRSALDESGPARTTTTVPTTQPTTTATTTTAATTTTTTGAAEYHTIVGGDTFQQLALDNNTTVDELVRLNPGVNPAALTVGQKIRIR